MKWYEGADEIPVSQVRVDTSRAKRPIYIGHVTSGLASLNLHPASTATCSRCDWRFESDDPTGKKAWDALYAHADTHGEVAKPDARTVPK